MNFTSGWELSLALSGFFAILMFIFVKVRQKNGGYAVSVLFSGVTIFTIAPALYSGINFYLLYKQKFIHGVSDAITIDLNNNIFMIRCMSVYIAYKVLSKIIVISNNDRIILQKGVKIKDALFYEKLYFSQTLFYILSIFIIWESLFSGRITLFLNLLSFVFLFIIDDWFIIAEYMSLSKGKILLSHLRKMFLSNMAIYILIVLNITTNRVIMFPDENLFLIDNLTSIDYYMHNVILIFPFILITGLFLYLIFSYKYFIPKKNIVRKRLMMKYTS